LGYGAIMSYPHDIYTFIFCFPAFITLILNCITGPFSIIATIKIKKQKALSKWQKFSIITFPVSILLIILFAFWFHKSVPYL
jgi:hypothetical protein